MMTIGNMVRQAVVVMSLAVVAFSDGHEITVENRCQDTVWVGALGRPTIPENGGFVLPAGESKTVQVGDGWSGRFWGRTGCNQDGAGCATGDCARGTQCAGAGGIPPVTLAEITFDAAGTDFYDISLVDGYNLPMAMEPTAYQGQGYRCGRAGCNRDLNAFCPGELAVVQNGRTVACNSACNKFNTDEFCCRGAFGTPDRCPPFPYSQLFKSACPAAYSYAYDDLSSTFTCQSQGSNYRITFCPSS
ncbi:Thaumatin family [Plasmodiophora brassicae]